MAIAFSQARERLGAYPLLGFTQAVLLSDRVFNALAHLHSGERHLRIQRANLMARVPRPSR